MRTAMAMVIKFVLTLGAAALAGYFAGGLNWRFFFVLALLGTIINYLLGDLFILPAAGNIVASIADGGVAGLLGYFLAVRNMMYGGDVFLFAVTFGIFVAVAEFFFHKYLRRDEKVAP